ncbi:MAG: glutamate-cysteine ligase family protein [Polyangiales bacterium]
MAETTRAHKEVESVRDGQAHREFMRALLTDVRALERMLAEGHFETGHRRIGAEQEMFLIDRAWSPARGAVAMLERLNDPHYTTELGQFQLEANCDPQLLAGDGLERMHAQLDALVAKARGAAGELGMDVVLMGILPTLRKSDLGLDAMVPSPRYIAMNKIVTELRGGRFELSIKGLDELIIDHDSVMIEACNSSFQVHLQVDPANFARRYNIAQVLLGPLMSISANSPLVFGRRLWAETRIALFRQAVDTRSHTHHIRETEARVSFGTRWVRNSVAEIFKEDVSRFRALVGTELDEDPMAMLDRGELPKLKALRLHNGTIYRWNRACFGFTEGKAHLRIENRIMPSGPSVIDQVANSAFWFGLMAEMHESIEDITRRIEFDVAGSNFYTAAREGLGAHILWLDGEEIPARNLVLDRLLPMAEAGLRRENVREDLIKKYLDVVDARARTSRTGARWAFSSWNALREHATPGEAANAIVAATVDRQRAGIPVAQWDRAEINEAQTARNHYLRVEQYMRTDLFTVQVDDPVEMVANLMVWERIRYVPVEDKDHKLLGLITYRAVLRALAEDAAARSREAREVMRVDVISVSPETPTVEAIRLMRRHKIGCLPVLQDDHLVGIVTDDDLMEIATKLLEERLSEEAAE